MKHRPIILLILFISLCLAIWLMRGWWLPWLHAFWQLLGKLADELQSFEALLAAIVLLGGGLWALLRWVIQPAPNDYVAPLSPTTWQEILNESIGEWGRRIRWIDRKVANVNMLRDSRWLVIIGNPGQGKTREAIELIRRATEDFIPNKYVYTPNAYFENPDSKKVESSLRRMLNSNRPALVFMEDLTGQKLDNLSTLLAVLTSCKNGYFIATASNNTFTAEHLAWLGEQKVHKIEIVDLNAEQTAELLENAANLKGMQIDDGARDIFIANKNHAPALLLLCLSRLYHSDIKYVNDVAAKSVIDTEIKVMWQKARDEFFAQHPAGRYLLQALSHCYVIGAITHRKIILPYAEYLWKSNENATQLQLIRHSRILSDTVSYLARNYDIVIQDDIITTPDYMNEAVEYAEARSQLVESFIFPQGLFQFIPYAWIASSAVVLAVHPPAYLDSILGFLRQFRREIEIPWGEIILYSTEKGKIVASIKSAKPYQKLKTIRGEMRKLNK